VKLAAQFMDSLLECHADVRGHDESRRVPDPLPLDVIREGFDDVTELCTKLHGVF
jgi:hypothetical protein